MAVQLDAGTGGTKTTTADPPPATDYAKPTPTVPAEGEAGLVEDADTYEPPTDVPRNTPLPAVATTPAPSPVSTSKAWVDDGGSFTLVRANIQETAPAPAATPTPVPEGVTPERQKEIETYVAGVQKKYPDNHVDGPVNQGQAIAAAVGGRSTLGELTDPEKQYLIDYSVDQWLSEDPFRPTNYMAINTLATPSASDPNTGAIVAQVYAKRAITMPVNEPWQAEQAAALANAAIQAAGDPESRRGLLEAMGPENAARFATVMGLDLKPYAGGQHHWGGPPNEGTRAMRLQQMLEAAQLAPPTKASAAFVDRAFLLTSPRAYAQSPQLADEMGGAIAAHWYPNDPQRASQEGARLAGILKTEEGRSLLANDKVPAQQRVLGLALVHDRPEWNADYFQKHGVWNNPEITLALAAPRASQLAALRGDSPQRLSGTDLENTIGFALGFPPAVPPNETEAERDRREAAVAAGQYSYYGSGPAQPVVGAIAAGIRQAGGANPEVTVLPVQYASEGTGAVSLPLFRVKDPATGAEQYVDNQGRVYSSFEEWKKNNALPPGNMVYPANGHLSGEPPQLVSGNTPRTVDTPQEKLKVGLDYATLVGGTIAGGAMLLGSGGLLAPVAFGAATAWQTFRSVEDLSDRFDHGQSINPLDPGSRSAWLGIGAGLISIGATGLNVVSKVTGKALTGLAATAAGALNLGGTAFDAATAADAGATLVSEWDHLSAGERAQLALSVGFWMGGAAATGKGAFDLTPQRRQQIVDQAANESWNAFFRDHPQASSLQGLTTEQLRATFGDRPVGGLLEYFAGIPGFSDFAARNPEGAWKVYRAQLQGIDIAPFLNMGGTFDQIASYLPSARSIDVPGTIPGTTSPYYVMSNGWALNNEPALRLLPGQGLDHNGAFNTSGTNVSDYRLALQPGQIQLPNGQPVDLSHLAVFSGHGHPYGFAGVSTSQAAQTMADEILRFTQNGGRIDQVLIDACGQGDSRFLAWGGTNAQAFKRELDAAMAARGLPPVTVLAAQQPGSLYGGDIKDWRGRMHPADFVPTTQQQGGIGGTGLALGALAGVLATEVGGGIIYSAVTDD